MIFDRTQMSEKLMKEFENINKPLPIEEKEDTAFFSFLPKRNRVFIIIASILAIIALTCYVYSLFLPPFAPNTVIHADPTPIKTHPVDPGGMVIPHKDSTIYDTLKEKTPGNVTPVPEKILPKAEEPVALPVEKKQELPDPIGAMIDNLPEESPMIYPTAPLSMGKEEKRNMHAQEAKELLNIEGKTEETLLKEEEERAQEPAMSKPQGRYRVQLGSFKKREEAIALSDHLQHAYGSLFMNLVFSIEQAFIEERGLFHRVKVGSFKDGNSARQFCTKLTLLKPDQGCFVVQYPVR